MPISKGLSNGTHNLFLDMDSPASHVWWSEGMYRKKKNLQMQSVGSTHHKHLRLKPHDSILEHRTG